MIKEIRIPQFGEDLFQIDMNYPPANDVEKIKHLLAEVAEIVKKNYENDRSPLKSLMFDRAVGELLSAEALVEKVLTYKHYTNDEQTI